MDASNIRSQRSDSSSSESSTATQRRGSAGLFSSLQDQKRANDPASVARRQSLHEQRPTAGFFGQMWNNYVHGPSSK